MFIDEIFNWGGNATQSDTKFIIQEYKAAVDFIQGNWTDELGISFVRRLQSEEQKLHELERRKGVLLDRLATLKKELYEIANDDNEDKPKTKTLRHVPQGDGFYPSGGGRSRTR